MPSITTASFLVLTGASALGIKSVHAAPGDVLWMDDFTASSSLNTAYWSYDVGTGVGGWGNQELQTYTSDLTNVGISANGHLEITARRNSEDGSNPGFTSGRIKTEGKMMFTYGTVEASIQIPNVADGLWPAFWTLGYNFAEVGWPRSGEIDVLEVGQGLAITQGVVNRRVITGAHWEHNDTYATYAVGFDTETDLYLAFHNYTMTWTPTMLATYMDGQKMWEMDISNTTCTDCEEFHHPHFLLLNLAVGGFFTSTGSEGSSGVSSSGGCSTSSAVGVGSSSAGGCGAARTDVSAVLPATMMVDYVKVMDNGYTQITVPQDEQGSTEPPSPIVVAPTSAPAILVPSPTLTPIIGASEAPFPVIEFGAEDDDAYDDDAYDDDSVECASGKGGSSGKGSRRLTSRGRRLCNSGKGSKGSKSSKKGGYDDDVASTNEYLASSADDYSYHPMKLAAAGCTIAALAQLAQ